MKILIRSLVGFISIVSALHAQVPQLINYQGRVAVAGVNFDGAGQLKFAIVGPNGSTSYWSNDGTSTGGSQPATAVSLTVTKGLYSVLLGDVTLVNMTAIPAAVFTNSDVRLRVWFNDGTNGSQLLAPDQRIAAVGYAMMAGNAATVSDGAITSAKIATGAVGNAQLATGAVQTANIATGAVANTQLANSGLTVTAGNGLGGGGAVSLGGNVTLSNAGVLSLTGGGGITVNAATGAITLGSNATSGNSASTIVQRDATGSFSAGNLSLSGFQPFVTLFDTNAANTRSRIQTAEGDLFLEPASYLGGQFDTGLVVKTGTGFVGIGTLAPIAKLHAQTGQANTTAVYGNATGASGVGVYARSIAGPAVYAEGHAVQLLDKSGFVKAMAYINPFLPAANYVVRGYNSRLSGNAATTVPCGIIVTRNYDGNYSVDFGFDVRNRFFAVTLTNTYYNASASPVGDSNPNVVVVEVGEQSSRSDEKFQIIVF